MIPGVKVNSAAGFWAKSTANEIKQDSLSNSPDVILTKATTGTTIKTKQINRLNPLYRTIPTEWHKDKPYGLGDDVYITDSLDADGKIVYAGLWLCIKNVPSNEFTGIDTTLSSSIGYFRDPEINYYPQWPLPTDLEKRYWLLLTLYPTELTLCEDGNTWYVNAQQSGSAIMSAA
jgi:hypothetical protein